jgi:hypothetical protein
VSLFGTIKAWMGATHFLMKRLRNVSTEMSLHVLAYNLKRAMQIVGVVPLMQAMRASGPFFLPCLVMAVVPLVAS